MGKVRHYAEEIKKGRLRDMFNEVKWVYRFAKKHVVAIVLYTLLGLTGVVISLISSLVSRDLVDVITGEEHSRTALLVTFVTMISITLISTLIGQISSYVSAKINFSVDNSIKAEVFDEIMVTEWESLSRYHSGDILMRWNGDSSVISSSILNLLPNLMIYSVRFISALILVVREDASFAVFAIASIPVSLIISRESMRRMRKENAGSAAIGAKLSGFNQETFLNIQTVKAFDMISCYSRRLRDIQKEYTGVKLRYQRISIINSIILTIVSMLVTYSAQGWGVYKVWSGAISYGTMVMLITLSSSLSGCVSNLISLVPNTISLTVSSKRLRALLELPKEDYSAREEVREFYEQNKDKGVGLIAKQVSYAYATGNTVFENLDFEAYPHEIVALVGPSGEGKTTMMRLLLALIKANEGEGYICAGNAGLTQKNAEGTMQLTPAVRQLCAYVPQGNTMLSGTIADNMRNVKEDATDEEIIEALKMACAWDFVEKLPEGINNPIGERGNGYSEGQSQRLAIARAIIRKSPILLLDEATSALDVYTERRVLQNILSGDAPRTIIVTTHRPSVLSICDRVYSIHDKECKVMDKEGIEKLIHAGEGEFEEIKEENW